MHKALLLTPLLFAACSSPKYVATKTVSLEVPLEQAALLHCRTHNGSITVSRGDRADAIQVVSEIKVRGYTQQEADDNLHLLEVGWAHEDEKLRIFGDYPASQLRNRSPSFSFTMSVPEHLALALVTHNGNVRHDGTSGELRIETHNGNVTSRVANPEVHIVTHNGGIDVAIDAPGELEGKLITHNGGIDVELAEGANGWIEARTHNGRISPPRVTYDAAISRRSLRCRVSEEPSDGKLVVTTHNGNIDLRGKRPGRSEIK